MPISVNCGACGKKLKAGEHLAGKRVKCPACQAAVAIPEPERAGEPMAESFVESSEPESPPDDGELDWSQLDLSDRKKVEDVSRPQVRPRKLRPIATDSSLLVPPRAVAESSVVVAKPRRKAAKANVPSPVDEPTSSWRDHLHWLLALALLPLAISLLTDSDAIYNEIEQLLQEHPELAQAEDKEALLGGLPDKKLPSAHLAHDSLLHWGYAVLAAVGFLGLLACLFPGAKAGPVYLLVVGLATGTIGIVLLLLFQFIALATRGVWIRGRGWGVLLFLIVKFIGFSYDSALDPENGLLLSFLGFTFGVGLCEELCKALPIIIYLRTTDKADWKGACLVGLASGVGFGISEGITYSGENYNGIAPILIYFVRFLSCVTLHAVWSGTVALRMERNQDYIDADWEWEDVGWFLLNYLAIVMVLHGLYDTLLKKEYDALALIVAIASFGWWAWQLRQVKLEEA